MPNMRKYLLKNKQDFLTALQQEINLDHSKQDYPREYPAIAIVAYAGAGWDEIDFVYQDDFS